VILFLFKNKIITLSNFFFFLDWITFLAFINNSRAFDFVEIITGITFGFSGSKSGFVSCFGSDLVSGISFSVSGFISIGSGSVVLDSEVSELDDLVSSFISSVIISWVDSGITSDFSSAVFYRMCWGRNSGRL